MIAIFLPIADRIAIDHNINPVYYLLPLPAATSFAFMLPIGTTSNAIVMSSGHIKLKDMVWYKLSTCIDHNKIRV
jgi:sodium-dependent dicarboxylate transporter 2/3/5